MKRRSFLQLLLGSPTLAFASDVKDVPEQSSNGNGGDVTINGGNDFVPTVGGSITFHDSKVSKVTP